MAHENAPAGPANIIQISEQLVQQRLADWALHEIWSQRGRSRSPTRSSV